MDPIPDDFSYADLLRNPEMMRDALRFIRQMRNIDVIQNGGNIKRIQVTPKSLNAFLDLRDNVESGIGTSPPPFNPTDLCAETAVWKARAIAAGGTFHTNSISICHGLCVAIAGKAYKPKIVSLYPFLGSNLATARVPLIDQPNAGIAGNTNFVEADYSQTMGLQGDGSTKYLDTGVKPGDLGSGDNGGLGWWELGFTGVGNAEPMGAYKANNSPDNRFSIDLRTTSRAFQWGTIAIAGAGESAPAENLHYYGQCSGASERTFWATGTLRGTNTAAATFDGIGDQSIILCGCDTGTIHGVEPWPGRVGVAYMTDGTMAADEIADFHTLLSTYLMIPTGRAAGSTTGTTFPNPADVDDQTEGEESIDRILVSATGEVVTSRTGYVLVSRA